MLTDCKSFKKLLLIVIVSLVLLLVIPGDKPSLFELISTGTFNSEEIVLHPGLSFMVESDQKVKIKMVGPTVREETLLRQSSYQYTIKHRNQKIGQITVTLHNLTNGDVLLFVESRKATKESHSYRGRLTLSGPFHTGRTLLYPQRELLPNQSDWHTFYPAQSYCLPEGIVYLDGQENSVVLGTVDIIKYMGHGVWKEVQTIPISFNQNQKNSELRFLLSDTQSGLIRFWGVISNDPLVNWKSETDVSTIQIADLNQTRKLWLDGVYDIVPDSYFPTDPRGFWRCPAQHVGKSFLSANSRFTYAIAVSSMYGSINTQNEAGYWPTGPLSNWLAEDYDFSYNFYDTRFNTDAALYLLEAYRKYGEDKALDSAFRYSDFLCSFAQESAYRTKNGGYLVPDYQDSSGRHKTHTSLNHLLAEMNFLYEIYLTTGNRKCMNIAEKMLLAVKDTCNEWIKDTGELWYARLPNGDYGLEDYPTLTLKDLRHSQQLISQIYGRRDPDLARLISSKEAYNRANGLPLW